MFSSTKPSWSNRSEIRRKRFRLITRESCGPKDQRLVLVRGMKIRWNTTNAEIERGTRLEPALTRWNLELPRGLTGKKKATTERKAARQYLLSRDFKDLRRITNVMEVIQDATLDLCKKGVGSVFF
ncbi:hypothetical protein B0H13DRAFT_2302236 [Mycena leptocephala]|nr:hypothetical protein B0H13DRAFT_2302236 [Mycena leptocephala]